MIDPEDLKGFYVTSSLWSEMAFEKELLDADYLDFANRDLADGQDKRHIINAVSNAKRALHLSIDNLVEALGAYNGSCKPTSPFPQKLEFCRQFGIASPRIIEKINRIRNKVEHYYYIPTLSEAEDFIDIVVLFLHAIKGYSIRFPEQVQLESPEEFFAINTAWLNLEYKIGSGKITGDYYRLECTQAQLHERAEIIKAKKNRKIDRRSTRT